MSKTVYRLPLILLLAGAVVSGLAVSGKLDSMIGFPLVFALICALLGLVSLWRDRPRTAVVSRSLLFIVAASLPVGGWFVHKGAIEKRRVALQAEVSAALTGRPAPPIAGLEPLNIERATLDAAAAFSGKATIVTFWATWCSPCWTELRELDELYRAHCDDGLAVVAITRYGDPDDADRRRMDRDKALKFIHSRDLTFPAAIAESGDVHRDYRVNSIPSTALVDENGELVAYGVGLDGGRALMRQAAAMVRSASDE